MNVAGLILMYVCPFSGKSQQMMSLKTQSNSETALLVSLHGTFAFNFPLVHTHCGLNVQTHVALMIFVFDLWALARRSMLLNMTSGSLEAFGGDVSRAEL